MNNNESATCTYAHNQRTTASNQIIPFSFFFLFYQVPGYVNIYSTNALGRIYTVHPRNDECFYLRLFLVNVPGPTSFQLLRNCAQHIEKPVNVYIYQRIMFIGIANAAISSTSHRIRLLFVIIISTGFISSPYNLWNKYKEILHRVRSIPATYDCFVF